METPDSLTKEAKQRNRNPHELNSISTLLSAAQHAIAFERLSSVSAEVGSQA